MSLPLVLFEDRHWRDLRPLTDVLPVPALRFGASSLSERLRHAAREPLHAVIARPDVMAAWHDAPAAEVERLEPGDLLVLNAAALPGAWLEAVRAARAPALFLGDGRIAGAKLTREIAATGRGLGEGLEAFLLGLGAPTSPCDARFVSWPWQLVEWNAAAIAEDLAAQPAERAGEIHPSAVLLEPARIAIGAGAVVEALAVLDARPGPIRIGARARIAPHTLVTGPCVIGAGTQLLGGAIARSTFGPECRVAGEVEESVWQGYANKRHHGFVGHSAIGEWVNLGALTTTSDLKNNYGNVRVWVDGREVDSRSPKVGAVLGAHVKTGIGTLLPTGAVVGVGANLFGGGTFAPKQVPAFGWWDGEHMAEHRLAEFLATAQVAQGRRGRTLEPAEAQVLERLFAATARERGGG